MSLGEVRQLYFQLREEVFAGGVLSITKRTDALENMLKTQFKNKRLKDVEYPKYVVWEYESIQYESMSVWEWV